MRKSKQFLGIPVISLEEGQQVGTIKGLVINPTLKNVAALIIDQKGWFREQKFVPYSKVHSTGEDAVTIDRVNRVEKGVSLPEILKLFKDRVTIIGSRLVTENGTALGVVEEFYVDLQTGDIVGLEFSGGTVNALLKGSAFLDINYVRTFGNNVVVCNDSALNNIVRMEGGLQEALKSIRENTEQLLEATAQKTKGWSRNINDSIDKLKRARSAKKTNGTAATAEPDEAGEPPCNCSQHQQEKPDVIEPEVSPQSFAEKPPSEETDNKNP